jgi:hypothetical protein
MSTRVARRADRAIKGGRRRVCPKLHAKPLGWERIGLTGDYVWAGTEPASNFRPLNDVRPTYMPRAA